MPANIISSTLLNNNHPPPPQTSITKSINLGGPFMKKDRRQMSSRFNASKHNIEIETLPALKGKFYMGECHLLECL